MVFMYFPANLTEEEEILQKKYAKLRKKKKALQASKTARPERESASSAPVKRPNDASAEDATEQAKKLIKSGIIKIEAENLDKQGFKRSKNFERKMKDPEKTPTAVGFQPFSATQQQDDDEKTEVSKTKLKGLYQSFVTSGRPNREPRQEPEERRERDFRSRERNRDFDHPRKGNTIYVFGHGLTEELLKKTFSNIGPVVHINMEADRNCGFVTFDKLDSAEKAISEMHGSMIAGVQLKVSMARRQPTFEQPMTDPSATSWAALAASTSQKGNHRDKRDLVAYTDSVFD